MKLHFLHEAQEFDSLKKKKIPLTDEEREEAIKAGAVWHHGPGGAKSCAIWKSKRSNGDVVYVTNTHRVYQTSPILKGTIKLFHEVVKDTA